jgi:hypothetical protein
MASVNQDMFQQLRYNRGLVRLPFSQATRATILARVQRFHLWSHLPLQLEFRVAGLSILLMSMEVVDQMTMHVSQDLFYLQQTLVQQVQKEPMDASQAQAQLIHPHLVLWQYRPQEAILPLHLLHFLTRIS